MKETKLQRSSRQAFERKLFVEVLRQAGNTVLEEHRFYSKRRWRFDIALPECSVRIGQSANCTIYATQDIAVEIEGYGMGHQGTKAMREDLEKYLEAFALGWNVLRVSWAMIADGRAIDALYRYGVPLSGRSVQPTTATAE